MGERTGHRQPDWKLRDTRHGISSQSARVPTVGCRLGGQVGQSLDVRRRRFLRGRARRKIQRSVDVPAIEYLALTPSFVPGAPIRFRTDLAYATATLFCTPPPRGICGRVGKSEFPSPVECATRIGHREITFEGEHCPLPVASPRRGLLRMLAKTNSAQERLGWRTTAFLK